MRITFLDHAGFQRAVLAAVTAGAIVAGATCAFALPAGSWLATLALALVSIAVIVRRETASSRRALALVTSAAAVWWARVTAAMLAIQWGNAPSGWVDVAVWAFGGLVASLGWLPLYLELDADTVGRALQGALPQLATEERALCGRAASAEKRIRAALAGNALADARKLRRLARALALNAIALARKVGVLANTLATTDEAAIAGRIDALAGHRATVTEDSTGQRYEQALRALRDQREHIGALATAADRLRAHLHEQVALLESTALALAARSGAAAADEAAALSPLVERLRDVAITAQAEAAALASVDAV